MIELAATLVVIVLLPVVVESVWLVGKVIWQVLVK